MENRTEVSEEQSKSKLKDKLDVEVLYWFFGCEGDIVEAVMNEAKAKTLKDLVSYLRKKY